MEVVVWVGVVEVWEGRHMRGDADGGKSQIGTRVSESDWKCDLLLLVDSNLISFTKCGMRDSPGRCFAQNVVLLSQRVGYTFVLKDNKTGLI